MIRDFNEVVARVKRASRRKRCGVVAADAHAIEAALEAQREGLAQPVFIGDEAAIRATLRDRGARGDYAVHQADSLEEAAAIGVRLAREGEADFLLKGHIDTAILLKAVVNKETGLGTGRLMTHCAFNEVPTYHKLLVTTDGGMVTYPDVDRKQGIIENAVGILHRLGYDCPKVACLAAVEKLNPKMPETVDADELKRRNQDGRLSGCLVEGPISFDLAFDPGAARLKDYSSPVAGDADVMLVPSITVGNVLGKALVYAAGGRMAGFIVGARCPIVLTSRSSTAEEKFLSIALSALLDG